MTASAQKTRLNLVPPRLRSCKKKRSSSANSETFWCKNLLLFSSSSYLGLHFAQPICFGNSRTTSKRKTESIFAESSTEGSGTTKTQRQRQPDNPLRSKMLFLTHSATIPEATAAEAQFGLEEFGNVTGVVQAAIAHQDLGWKVISIQGSECHGNFHGCQSSSSFHHERVYFCKSWKTLPQNSNGL